MIRKRSYAGLVFLLIIIDLGLFFWIGYSFFTQEIVNPLNQKLEETINKGVSDAFSFDIFKTLTEEEIQENLQTSKNSGKDKEQTDNSLDIEGIVDFDYNTTEKPMLVEFTWLYEGVYYQGIPQGAVIIDDYPSIAGDWKALIWYDPEGKIENIDAKSLFNINISGQAEEVVMTFDWNLIVYNSQEVKDESDMPDEIFTGKLEEGKLAANGFANLKLEIFYFFEGKEYALGTMQMPDGSPALIALVRP